MLDQKEGFIIRNLVAMTTYIVDPSTFHGLRIIKFNRRRERSTNLIPLFNKKKKHA